MDSIKYKYWHLEGHCTAGECDMAECLRQPVDVNGCTLLLCIEGSAIASVDFRRQRLRPGSLVVVSFEMTFILHSRSKDFKVLFVSVSLDLATQAFFNIASSAFWEFLYRHPALHVPTSHREMLEGWFRQTEWMVSRYTSDKHEEMVKNNLCNLFLALYGEVENLLDTEYPGKQEKNRALALVSQFYVLLDRHYAKHRDVAFYAQKLSITPDYLHKLITAQSDLSPKEVINFQLIIAIKNYLTYTDLSIKSIASELNFEGASYMCRFFKKKVGMSPLEYRNSNKLNK